MTTTERHEWNEKREHLDFLADLTAAMQSKQPTESVAICPRCRTFQVIRTGTPFDCPNCARITGTEEPR